MDSPASASPQTKGQKWIERIQAASKREEDFLKQAGKAENVYLNNTEEGAHKFYMNVLHSNIETIVPAIYSATPKPDIRRRWNDSTALDPNDPASQQKLMEHEAYRSAATVIERAIIVQTDDGALDSEMEGLAQSSFMAGRGVVRVRLVEEEPTTGEIDDDVTEDSIETATNEDQESNTEPEAEETQEDALEAQQSVQRLVYEAVSWRDFRFGPAKRWKDVPWVAFRHMVPEETIREWTKDEGVKAQLAALSSPTVDGQEDTKGDTPVWEIWCKTSKTVKFIRETDGVIYKTVADPLGLTGFFPCTRPVQPIERVGSLTPVCPFSIYEELAEELDKTTRRIRKLIEGIKVRGGAAAGEMFKGVSAIAELGDNEIAEIQGVEAFAQQGGLDGGITWWPLEKAIEALRELAVHREGIKSLIYEVTGISDIVRGASDSDETATAQTIKSQWGSLRIQKMQRLIERAVREIFIISAELIGEKFTGQTLQAITGMDYTPEIDAVFKSHVSRVYRIDVETDSTIKSDMSKSKAEMAEFLQGTAAFFQSMAPMAQGGMIPQSLMSEIYASFAKTFRLGKQTEDALEQWGVQAKQAPPPPSPEVQQQMQQLQERAAQMQQEGAKLAEENQTLKTQKASEAEAQALKLQFERTKNQQALVHAEQKHQQDMAFTAEKNALAVRQAEQAAMQKLAMAQQDSAIKIGMDEGSITDAMAEFGKMIVDRMEQGDAAILRAITAPKTVRAVRGKDGKIEGAVSETVLN
jgi:vacuolar-type H+-ATPase subunit I/STV1